jgi:hypothetical protein
MHSQAYFRLMIDPLQDKNDNGTRINPITTPCISIESLSKKIKEFFENPLIQ